MQALAGTSHESRACSRQANCGCRQTAAAATSERTHIHACAPGRAMWAKAGHGIGRQDAAALLLLQAMVPIPVPLSLVPLKALLKALVPLRVLLPLGRRRCCIRRLEAAPGIGVVWRRRTVQALGDAGGVVLARRVAVARR